ncbi:ketoacyl-ACP synthase III [Actinocorallia sp. API 0066]|uniref:beta-ketoacyl-ACP synthase III n=1 Tax=Actinocorallia sp. API 0066 TaxID=2896846 RepID=UPI001E2D6903|nr:beta-ketoacyl-ACP synthase III [Actinocorallia sp. API 0066]MCD0451885.1 ketoacyl-ACP synthase III [Actinocorallia sp. API 0066]
MIQLAQGRTGARILAFGHYQPDNVVTNDDLAARGVDTNDAWIRSRVGIAERRIALDNESVLDLAVAAGGKALAASGLTPGDIDLVIVATCTAETQVPNASATVAFRLGISAPGAFDVNAACAGFAYALSTASDAIRAGSAQNVLVIGAEKFSPWIDWNDRTTCIIFADGAGAAVVTGSDVPQIGPVVWGSDGENADKIMVQDRNSFLSQDGQAVFRWATTALHPVALEACRRAGIAPSELGAFVPHQANLRIIHGIARKLNAPNAVIAEDIVNAGNTSAASIPMALSRMIERGDVRSGEPALIIGFGAGLTYAAQVIQIP